MNFEVTGDQAQTLELALRVAAEEYRKHAKSTRALSAEMGMTGRHEGLALQFDRQAEEADALRARVEAELF